MGDNPIFIVVFAVSLVFLSAVLLVYLGNIQMMQFFAKCGLAVFCGNIMKDTTLLQYVNKEGVGWLSIPEVCYGPIMGVATYKHKNFLNKQSLFGELYIEEIPTLRTLQLETKDGIPDLAVIHGSSQGVATSMRQANFMYLRKCAELLHTNTEICIADAGRIRVFTIKAVMDSSRGEIQGLPVSTREGFLDQLVNKAEIKSTRGLQKDKSVILLKCQTDVDFVIVLIQEK